MMAGILLIFLLQWAFLGNVRSAVIVAMTIPFALSFAIGLMILRGESANLLSVGAIDFGLVVDATVIMVENIFRHLAEASAHLGTGPSHLHRMRVPSGFRGKMGTISLAAAEVSQSIFFAAAIIIAGFVPLFTLSGIEGHIFGPMAKTYAYAIAGGLIATFTVAPALSLLLFPQEVSERETPVVRALRRVYQPALEFVLANRIITFSGVALIALLAILAVRSLGLEFLPKLEEGNLWIRATFPQSVSLDDSDGYVNRMRLLMSKYPEVRNVVSQHGRPDDGTDATGFFNAEFFVPLKPFETWPAGMNKERLTQQMTQTLQQQFPGVDFNFSQYIQDNVEEAASGVKGENSVKVYGNDLETLEKTANAVAAVLAKVPGITDLAVLRSLGQPTIRIDVDRSRAARYGLAPGDVNAVVQTAIGGQSAGDLYEGTSDRHFPMMVRLASPYRENLAVIRRIPVAAAGSGSGLIQVPLDDVADVHLVSGAAFIYREQQQRYVPIKFSVRGRDLGGAVLEAQRAVDAQVLIPGGYRLEWVGEFGNLQEAISRLSVAVPLSIALIILLLYLNFHSLRDALLAASVIPMALLGGIFALWVTGTAFSVSSAIGFVALVRNRRHGRHFGGVVLPLEFGVGARSGERHAADLPHPIEAGHDDLHRGMRRLDTRGLLHRHRVASPAAARAGGRRRNAARTRPDTAGIAGADLEILDGAGNSGRGGRMMRPQRVAACATALAAVAMGACVGPNFHRPPPPSVERYTQEPLAAATASAPGDGGAAQRFLAQQDVPRNWWTLFGSEELDALVEQALRNNPDVASAQAALRQAMENTAAQRGAFFPTAQASFDAQRQRNAVGVLAPTLASGTSLFNLYTPQVAVTYVPDVFGANRRQVESLAAVAEATRFELDATYLTLTANVVTTAIQEAGLRAQIAGTERVIALERESLEVLRRQLELGSGRRSRRVCAGCGARATGGDAAAAAQAAASRARFIGRSYRPFAGGFRAGSHRIGPLGTAARSAARSALTAGGAEAGRAGRRGPAALGDGASRGRHGEHAAAGAHHRKHR